MSSALAATNTFPSSGATGIGTTSPGYPLEVHGPGVSGAEGISVVSNGNIGIGILLDGSPDGGHKYHLYSVTTGGGSEIGDFLITDESAPWANRLVITPSGKVGIGTSAPVVGLNLSGWTDALALPVGTTAQRPTGANGEIRYNSSLPAVEAYVNSAWTPLSGASSGGQLQCSGGTCNSTGST
jgi:hypothetical protein